MKISFISIGKQNNKNLDFLIEDYTKRISKYFTIEWKVVPTSEKETESEKILKDITADDFLVALDEKGKELDTVELSKLIEKRMISGDKRVVFVIGGAYGLGDKVLKRANFVWSLSKLTFPHQIVRLILAESVYRAISIIKNEPYHHA
jgi:23S rRNA (pseudouridine1915-N3)-methyltransferase